MMLIKIEWKRKEWPSKDKGNNPWLYPTGPHSPAFRVPLLLHTLPLATGVQSVNQHRSHNVVPWGQEPWPFTQPQILPEALPGPQNNVEPTGILRIHSANHTLTFTHAQLLRTLPIHSFHLSIPSQPANMQQCKSLNSPIPGPVLTATDTKDYKPGLDDECGKSGDGLTRAEARVASGWRGGKTSSLLLTLGSRLRSLSQQTD